MGDRIRYRVDLDVNQQQLKALENELTKLQNLQTTDLLKLNPKLDASQARAQLRDIKEQANEVQSALSKAFNVKLNVTNFQTLQRELSNLDLGKVYTSFQKAGAAGIQAFNQIPSAVMKTNLQLKESHTLLDKMGTTLVNSFKWSAASSVVNRVANSIEGAWSYAKSLDTSLNDIRIVAGKSADEMERFAKTANQAAQRLGKSTTDYTNAALIYYQQGLNDTESQKRAEVTLKTANVTGQSTRTVSEQLTSVWNGYNVSVEDSEAVIDKLAAVAATTASDLEELSTGMSKVASAANIMGVDVDQLSAQLATIISVTRQAPESVGTALKTIYARMGDIEAGLDGETSLDQYTEKMSAMGVNVLNAEGKLRDMGEVIEEVGSKWPELSREQQVALSQIMAGTRQYNNLLSLFNNWDMYKNALKTSQSSLGTLQKQQDTYMESTKAHIEQLDAAWERVFDAAVNNAGTNELIDVFTGLTNGLANFIEALGGGANVLATFGSLGMQVFSKQIAHSINISIKNMNAMKENAAQLQGQLSTLQKMQEKVGKGNNAGLDARIQERQKLQSRVGYLNNNQIQRGNDLIDAYGTAINNQQAFQQKKTDAMNSVKAITSGQGIQLNAQELEQVFQEGSDASGKFANALETSRSQVDLYRESLNKFIVAQKEYRDALALQTKMETKYGQNSEEAKNANNNRREKATQLGDAFKDVKKNMKEMSERTDVSKEVQEALQETNERVQNIKAPGQTREALKNLANDTQGVAQDIDAAITDINNNFNELGETVDSVTRDVASGMEEQLDGAVEGTRNEMNNFFTDADREAMINGMVNLAAGFGQVASAAMSISNLGDIITNEDISTWDKFLQVSMNLGTSIPMLVNGFAQIKTNFSTLTGIITKVTGSIKTSLTTQAAENLQLKIKNTLLAQGVAENTASAFAENASRIAVEGHSAALTKEIALLVAKKALMAVGIVAAIGAVIGITYSLIQAYNADADAAKKATETAKDLADEHTKVKEELDNLKSSFDAYETAKEKLDSCTKGTQEWKDALKETNQVALDLIENINGLSGEDIRELYSRDKKTGEIQINENKAKELIENKSNQELSSRLAVVGAQKLATDASNQAQILSLTRENMNKTSLRDPALGAIKYGGYALSPVVGLGMQLGAELAEEQIANEYKETLMNNLDKFNKDQTLTEFKDTISKLGVNVSELTNSELTSLQDSLQKFAESADAATEKLSLMTQAIVDEKLGDKYDSTERAVAAADVEAEQERIKNDIISKGKSELSASSNAGSDYYQELARRLNEATNGAYKAATGNTVQHMDGNRSFIFEDKEGNKTDEKSLSWVATTIAAYEALEKTGASAEKASIAFDKLENNLGENLTTGIKHFIESGNLETLTQEELQKLMGMDKNALAEAMGVNADEVNTLLGKYDFEDLSKAGQDYQKALSSLLNGTKEVVKKQFNDIQNISKLSLSQQTNILDALESAYTIGGEKLLNSVSSIFKEMSAEDLAKFDQATNEIDNWSRLSVDEFRKKLKESGIEIKASNEALEKYIALKAQEITVLDKVIESYAKANEVASDLEKRGDSISKEDYATMTKYLGDSVDTFFTRTLDGTYKLIKGADELQKTIKDLAVDDAVKNIQQNMRANEEVVKSGKILNNIKNTALTNSSIEKRARDAAAKDQIDFLNKISNPSQSNVTGIAYPKYDPIRGSYNEVQSTQEKLNQQQTELLNVVAKEAATRTSNGPKSQDLGTVIRELTGLAKQTQFGNVDLNNRQRLTLENGDYETVHALSGEWGEKGISLAVTPLLQTDSGTPIELTDKTLNAYLDRVVDLATDENGNVNTAKIFEIDRQGLEQDGQFVKGLIADVGKNAEYVAQIMHFLGTDGALAEDEYLSNVNQYTDQIKEQFKQQKVDAATSTLNALDEYAQATKNNTLQEQIKGWRESIESAGEVTKTVLDGIQAAINKADAEIYQAQLTLANSAEDLKELFDWKKEGKITDGRALSEASLNLYNENREKDLETDEIRDYAQYIEDIAKSSKEFSDSLGDGSKEAAEKSRNLAIQILRMNEAVDTLADNWKNWSSILKKSSRESDEYRKALDGTKEAVADLLDIDKQYVSESFIKDHMNDIAQAATGDAAAIDRLRAASLESILVTVSFKDDKELVGKFKNIMTELKSIADAQKLEVGASLDLSKLSEGEQQYINTLNDMMRNGEIAASDVNAALSAIGYDPVYDEEEIEVEGGTVPVTTTHHRIANFKMNWFEGGLASPTWDDITTVETRNEKVDGVKTIWPSFGSVQNPPTFHKLKGVSKKASGSANNYSSRNSGGGSPGKSGGGGGSKAKDPDKMDKVEDKADRYHKVDTQLTKIDNNLSKIQSQEKKLTGAKLIANLNGQLDQLNDRIDRLREKVKIAQGEASELRNKLAGQGVQFNEDGTISNYMEIYNAKLGALNAMIDRYNGMSAEEQEKYKEQIEATKKEYEQFKEDLDRYDELVSDFIPGIQNNIQEEIDKQIEINIKKFNIEFEARLDIADAKQDWNEFKKTILDGIREADILGNAKARVEDDMSIYLDKAGNGMLSAATKQSSTILEELKKMDNGEWSSIYGDDKATALEQLQEAYQKINESLLEMDAIQEDAHQAWLDTMDDVVDKAQKQLDLYEQISGLIDHDMKVIELIYGETDYEALGKYYDKQHENNLKELDFRRQQTELWKEQLDSRKADAARYYDEMKKYENDKSSQEYINAKKNYERSLELVDSSQEKWMDSINELNAKVEESIEAARNKMENAINDVFKKFNEGITDGKGLDYLQQQWELTKDVADQYLDSVNEAFGIRQLERKYQDAIDNTDNVSAQRKLNKLMEDELTALKEKDKLTEYDVERANKKYEIALKQLALEEAQQTKNTMRLRRDSQGNYRYEYVADEDNINKLKDELDALENSLYNFDKERYVDLQSQIVDAIRDREEAIKEILMDASLTEEERQERLAEVNDLHNQKIEGLTDRTVTAQQNLYDSGKTEIEKIWNEEKTDLTTITDDTVKAITPLFKNGVTDMIEAFSGPKGFEEKTTDSMGELIDITRDYQEDLGEVEKAAGQTFDELEKGQDKNIPLTEELVQDNQELTSEFKKQLGEIQKVNKALEQQLQKYLKIIEAAKSASKAAYEYYQKEKEIEAQRAADEAAKRAAAEAAQANANKGSGGGGGNPGGGSGSASNGDKAEGVAAAIWIMGGAASGWYNGSDRFSRLREKFGNESIVQSIINSQGPNGQLYSKWNGRRGELGSYYYGRFKTGGYTGDWVGDYGKLAWVDKKEIVLNSGDTENLLDMVKIARDVVAASGPSATLPRISQPQTQATALEQDVHIEANFPNVESATEIKEALNSLVNLAAQRANRNTRG